MAKSSAASRRAAGFASVLLIGVTMARVLAAPLPAPRRAGEVALGVVALACALGLTRVSARGWGDRDVWVVAQSAVAALLGGGIVALGAGYVDYLEVIAVLLFGAIQLAAPAGARVRAVVIGTLLVDGVLVGVWLETIAADVDTLLVALGFMTGLQLLVRARTSTVRATAMSESLRSSAHAATAERIGTAIDVLGVTRAVLEATAHRYPLTTHALVLLHDGATGRLRPLPLYMTPNGVGLLESDNIDFTLAPGEGLAGKIFSATRPMLWPTAYDVHMAQANLGEQARLQLLQLRRGVPMCAIGAPLVIDDEVIGVFVITTHRQELAWADEDLPVVAALAGEAARAIERARRYERELDQAHLDSITGLANHRQLTRTLDQEVARARRRTTSLGVVFCDLDLFKAVNDTYGHAAGDRVLTILARVFHDSLRREDSAARYGGDEFVCVLPGADREETDAVGLRISTSFAARMRDDPELGRAGVSISCGTAIFPDDGGDVSALLQHADAAMRVVKSHRHNGANIHPGLG